MRTSKPGTLGLSTQAGQGPESIALLQLPTNATKQLHIRGQSMPAALTCQACLGNMSTTMLRMSQ